MTLTVAELNAMPANEFARRLDGVYEHSPWIAQHAVATRPFESLAGLKLALVGVVRDAGREAQLALIRAHPELAGKAMVAKTMTAESTHEQGKAGLSGCTPEEFARITKLNADYNAKFGFPFVICARENKKDAILAAFPVRLRNAREQEIETALAEIAKIARLRLLDAVSEGT